MKQDPKVENYISQFEGETLKRLNELRDITHLLVPEAAESISYGLIGYKYKGKPLVYFGGFKNHIGFYATPNGHDAFRQEFSKYKQGKGSVQLPLAQPLPTGLIETVILFRKDQLGG